MKFSLILFIFGCICITIGFSKTYEKNCEQGVSIKYVPRDVYNQIFLNKILPDESIKKEKGKEKK